MMQYASHPIAKVSRVAAVLGLALLAGSFFTLTPSGCDGDSAQEQEEECKLVLADGVGEPRRRARQSCWMLRTNGHCDDSGGHAICKGTTLSCPPGEVLGSECPGNPYGGLDDAGTR